MLVEQSRAIAPLKPIILITSVMSKRSSCHLLKHAIVSTSNKNNVTLITYNSKAREDREKYANVPFPDSDVSSDVSPTAPPPDISPSSNAKKPAARKRTRVSKGRKRTRKGDGASAGALRTDSDSNSNSDSDSDSGDPKVSALDEAVNIISDHEEDDDMDIHSPNLSPDRRIVDSKVNSDGLRLFKTAKGEWLSEAELYRLANMARNARLLSELGIEDAKQGLTTRPGGRAGDEGKEPELDDDRAFTVARSRPTLSPRECHPRQSKQGVS